MAEYIEREKVLAEREIEEYMTADGEEVYHEYIPASAVKAIPAADVREVVLCRDCKWWRGEGTICNGIGIDFDADGFCCEGERKEGADMREVDDGNR